MQEQNKEDTLQKEFEAFKQKRKDEIGEIKDYFHGLGPTYEPLRTRGGSRILATKINPALEEKIVDRFLEIMDNNGNDTHTSYVVESRTKNRNYILDAIETVIAAGFHKKMSAPEQLLTELKDILGTDALKDKDTGYLSLDEESLRARLVSLYENFEKENGNMWLDSASLFFPIVEYVCSEYIKEMNVLGRRTFLAEDPKAHMDEANRIKKQYALEFQKNLVREVFKDINNSNKKQ